jgi:N-methylhydantoinase B
VFVETMMGTWGGTPTHDGQDGVAHIGANQSNIPIEMIEREHPLRIERYGLVPDSGGAGRYRGGLAIVREFRLLAGEAMITVRSDKRRFPPYGLHGGQPGSPSMNIVNPGPQQRVLPVLFTQPVMLRQGDLYHHTLAGGGGHGDPLQRDPALVLRDLQQERVSPQGALRDYGVVATRAGLDWVVDADATARERAARAAAAAAT